MVVILHGIARGAGAGDVTGDGCHLVDLFVRTLADANGNAQVVDVSPDPAQPKQYAATLDYRSSGFHLEAFAEPRGQCNAQLQGPGTVMVDPGSNVTSSVSVQNSQTSDSDLYIVKVSRLRGDETQIKALTIANAILVPEWSPSIRNYTAYLDVSQDTVKVTFESLDNGQVVGLRSWPQETAADASSGRRLSETNDDGFGPAVGEAQHSPSTLLTFIDVGHERTVDLTVQSADGSLTDKYKFRVKRPFCPEERRFFDGVARVCTDICNEGFFGNPSTGRCSACLRDHCAVCETGLTCSMCDEGFEIQGTECKTPGPQAGLEVLQQAGATVQDYSSKHMTVLLGAGSAVLVALLACVALTYCTHMRRRVRMYDSDDEDVSLTDYHSNRMMYDDS